MRERGADGAVPLGGDGDDHEDGGGDEDGLEGVEEVGEEEHVPLRLGEVEAAHEHAHHAVVDDVVDQDQDVHDGC